MRSSPRPLRSWMRVAELSCQLCKLTQFATHAWARTCPGDQSATTSTVNLPPTGLALEAAANLECQLNASS